MLIASNVFIQSYNSADSFGKLIFFALGFLSVMSWVVLLYKGWSTQKALTNSSAFMKKLEKSKQLLEFNDPDENLSPFSNPYKAVYTDFKNICLEILNKNRYFSENNNTSYLSSADIHLIGSKLSASITEERKNLEKNLFILPTVVSLSPFLGLLGTVWGILITFAELQAHVSGGGNDMVLSGLSMALATTVLGLLIAIPALIAYNYLKTQVKNFEVDLENFATELLANVEIQFRKIG
jgi:biopolymer transport protein TolQ